MIMNIANNIIDIEVWKFLMMFHVMLILTRRHINLLYVLFTNLVLITWKAFLTDSVNSLVDAVAISTWSRTPWPSCHQTQSQCTYRHYWCHNSALRMFRLTGILRLRTESSRRWGDCLCQWRRTTCRSWRTWGWGHSSRGDGADTCPAE